jgi:hypothetical protein
VLSDAPPRSDQHPDPSAIQEADLLQVDGQLVKAAVNQLDQNSPELRAGGQVDLSTEPDQGAVLVVLDGESKLHHRHLVQAMMGCPDSWSSWGLGSRGDDSGTAMETPPCPCGPARRSPGILLPAWCPVCPLLVPPAEDTSREGELGFGLVRMG